MQTSTFSDAVDAIQNVAACARINWAGSTKHLKNADPDAGFGALCPLVASKARIESRACKASLDKSI